MKRSSLSIPVIKKVAVHKCETRVCNDNEKDDQGGDNHFVVATIENRCLLCLIILVYSRS